MNIVYKYIPKSSLNLQLAKGQTISTFNPLTLLKIPVKISKWIFIVREQHENLNLCGSVGPSQLYVELNINLIFLIDNFTMWQLEKAGTNFVILFLNLPSST